VKGLQHLHLRKRKAAGLEPYPARDTWLRLLDRVVLVVGILGPLTAIPQIIKIYTLHNATGVSLYSWLLPAILDVPWVVYGIVHGERPIFVTYLLWIMANLLVVIGILMYGAGPL